MSWSVGRGTRGVAGTVAPPATRKTMMGVCPIANDGQTTMTPVQAKWGTKSAGRLFAGDALTQFTKPSGVLLHVSAKPTTAITDAQIDAWLNYYKGHIVTFFHESDNDGLSATARAARIALWNRLYDRNVAIGHPCWVSHVFVGTFWGSGTTDATRNLWMDTARGDLIGLDYDGVHDLHTTPPADGITYYANTGSQTSASNKMTPQSRIDNIQRYIDLKSANGWIGYTVPEFGCQRAPWDTTGAGRTKWMQDSNELFIDSGAFAVHAYDDRAGGKDDVLYAGQPEKTYWQGQIDANPVWTVPA